MARRKPSTVHGFVIIDKPTGCTSHDVVDRIRRVLGERRVGHSGTLDPDASGLLLVGVGRATRLLRFLDVTVVDGEPTTSKEYIGTIVLGTETDTLDASGVVTATHDMSASIRSMTNASIQDVVNRHFIGRIEQVPPMVSARRVDGRRLHELAREGIEVEREAREVTIHSFDVIAVHDNVIDIRVVCSSGTYIRTLASDLGQALGGGAHLRGLRRTAIGAFTIDEAIPLDQFEALTRDDARAHLSPVIDACRNLSIVSVDEKRRAEVVVGKVLPRAVFSGDPPWAVVHEVPGQDLELLGVYEPFSHERVGDDQARPVVVMVTPEQ